MKQRLPAMAMLVAAMLATTGGRVARYSRPSNPDNFKADDQPEPIRDRVPQSEADRMALRQAEWKRARKNAKRAMEAMK